MNTRRAMLIVCLAVLLLLLVGCVPGDGEATSAEPAGFFWGIWHGLITPVTLIWSFFDSDVRIYEVANSGWWYDFGFMIGVSAVAGGGGSTATRNRSR